MAKGESKSYDPASVEAQVFRFWEEGGYFHAEPDRRTERFCMVIPPPNVTGALHLGHALNNTLQDILIRRERMAGKNTLWLVGTDHAGIATQATVEKTIRKDEGKSRHDLGRDELVRRIWAWKEKYGGRIVEQLKLMGCSCDYERERFTLDEGCAKAVRHTFFKLFRDGLIYRGKRLVNWDTQLQTAVADDEVYHETVKGHFYHFKYPVIDPQPGEPECVHIATTRPETMLGDTAVAVHPDPASALDKVEKALKTKLAEASEKDRPQFQAALDDLAERRRTLLPTLLMLRDMAKAGRRIRLPLVDREIPLICDHWAKPELGSGCVKITPAHDPNDYEVGRRHGLPMVNVLTEDGKVAEIIEPDGATNPHSAKYAGLKFATAGRAKVVEDMQAAGLVEQIEDRMIEIGHSDRSKAPIEPFLSDQWFLKMGDLDTRGTGDPRGANDPRTTSEPRTSVRADARVAYEPRGAVEPRTSVRADPALPRTPDLSQGAVLVTWTAYGTWLPGDDRGFVSRVPRADGGHTIHHMPGEPYDAGDPQLRNAAADRMQGEPVHLNKEQARVLLAAIAGTAERHGIELLAVAIMADHVHVLCQTDRSGAELQKLFKGAASRRLSRRFKLTDSPRWFTRRGSNRFIKK
ncbi:MAG: class I tRNA ligase family protein, partial [Phycisphaerae bacterium]